VTTFFKMTGSGNDFVFVDGREQTLESWPADRIRAVCDRRRGVGADGLVHLAPADDGAVRMRYYNADGSHADMCGNAALCATRLAVRLGLASPDRVVLATDAGQLESRCVGPGWMAELRFPETGIPGPVDLPLLEGETAAFHGTIGVPHVVLVVDDVASVDLVGRGRALRFHPRFAPAGANINFLGRTNDSEASWALRTYERGVENETLACGTGTIAAAIALATAGLGELPVRIRSASGLIYSVSGALETARATDVWLCGEGRLVFSGEWLDPV
jgi:diaminopimelate epimerase